MKKLLSFLICLIIIPVLLLGGAVATIYYVYFNPQPAEYQFLNPAEEIDSIEYADVSFTGGVIKAEGFGFVKNTESLMADLDGLDCHEGVSFEAIETLAKDLTVKGFVVNYTDGSYEIITPYISVNSELTIEEIQDILEARIYGYNVEAFDKLFNKYLANDVPII